MAVANKGIDIRQSSGHLMFRALLQDSSGALVTSGTTSLYLYELQDDGTLKSYDFNDNTFKTTALTTETVAMTHRTGNNGGTNTGLWTYKLTTLTGFTTAAIYFARVKNTSASPTDQVREVQFGGAESDFLAPTSAGRFSADATAINAVATSSVTAVNANVGTTQPVNFNGTGASAFVKGDLREIAGSTVSTSTAQLGVNVVNAAGTAWNSGAIGAATLASDTITAAKIAADAIGASELAADAVAEIADAVWDEARAGHVGAGSFGEGVASVQGNVTGSVASVTGAVGSVTGAVGSVTGNVGGNVTGSVGSVTTGGITAASFAAGAIDAAAIATNAIGAAELAADAVAEIADQVWDEAIAGHLGAGSTGAALNAAGAAGDPWSTALPGAYGAGTAGYIVGTNVDAAISSRLATAGYTAPPTAAANADAVWDEARAGHVGAGSFGEGVASVQGNVTGSVASVTGAVGSVGGNVGGNVVGSVGSVAGNVSGNVTGSVGSLGATAKTDVNAEVVDALNVDTYAEPTGVPPATSTLVQKIGRLYMALRNGLTVTATDKTFLDDGGAGEWKKPLGDDGTTYTEGEGTTP